jgi:hypothetical protein
MITRLSRSRHYQADMLAIWLTGRGTFGTFQLPFEEDWEACARAGP